MKISLQERQSIASLLNQLTHNEDKEIEIIIPFRAGIFDDPENIELLKNHTLLTGKNIHIFSPNEAYVNIFRKYGIPAEIREPLKNGENSPVIEEPFFREIEQELKNDTPEIEEFTKRYFDLGPKKRQNDFELQAGGEKHGEQNERIPEPPEVDASHLQPEAVHSAPEKEYMAYNSGKEVAGENEENKVREKDYLALFEPLKNKEGKEEDEKDLLQEDLKELSQKNWKIMRVKIGFALMGIVVIFIAYFYLPRATITVFAQREKDSFSLEVKAKKNLTSVDLETRMIPAQFIQITKTLTENFDAKEKGSFSEKATGKIIVYNENATPQPMIPSRFESSANLIYWSQRNIKIPARGSLEIEVIADKPGKDYDLSCKPSSPCQFTVPAWKGSDNFKKIHAKSVASLGGGVAGSGFIVSNDNYEKAQLILRNDLLKAAQQELSAQIPQQFTLLQDSVRSELLDISSTPSVNGLSIDGKATIKGTVKLQTFLLKETDLKELVDRVMKTQITKDKETKPDTVSVEYTIANMNFENGEVSLTVSASEETAFKVDIEDIKTKLIGKSEGEVRKFLSDLPKIQSANVILWPFWVRKIPDDRKRVDIDIR